MNRDGTFFVPRVVAPHVYVRVWALGCFHSHISTQALVYDIILPSTTAVGSRKLSANEQLLFFGAQTVVSLLQTTKIISDVYFITDRVAYASSNTAKIV